MTDSRYVIRQVPSGKWTTVRAQWPDGSKCQVPDTVTSFMTDSPDDQIRQLDGRFGDGLLPMGAVAIMRPSTGLQTWSTREQFDYDRGVIQ